MAGFDESLFDESLFDEADNGEITVSLSIVGSATVSIQLSEIVLPPPSSAGIRVAAWLRPAISM